LHERGFICRYNIDNIDYIQIINFTKHQNPHIKETISDIPAPHGHVDSGTIPYYVTPEQKTRIMVKFDFKCIRCGVEKNLSIDHIVPRTKGGGNDDENLQVLCKKCNASKGNKIISTGISDTSTGISDTRPGLAPEQSNRESVIGNKEIGNRESAGQESNEPDEKEKLPCKEIIEHLNLKAGTAYKYTSQKTRELIQARFNEKFTLQDFYTVIDKKVDEWNGTELQKFIRPETLFSNKFEGYLNQVIKPLSNVPQKGNFGQRPIPDDLDKFYKDPCKEEP